ncbi:MAG: cyclopropane-fatty-acyl-phospholipid synthase [Rhodobacteraceae bacterium]|nr:cyclopropane-fatty-acyl-phospholipid synthase [Paracoccaceae bacterium]
MWLNIFQRMLTRFIQTGSFEVRLPNGSLISVGDATVEPVRITLTDAGVLRRLCLNPELALGEAYMDGQLIIENDDLESMLAVLIANLKSGRKQPILYLHSATRTALRRLAQHNPARRSRSNVEHHYDLTDELYELFLDADLQYSCGYFPTGQESLDEAQRQKKSHIMRKLCLRPGLRILDIGSGWGGLGISLAKEHDCSVFGVTLSANQRAKSNQRAAAAGVADRVSFNLLDYRAINDKFDRIVSVGMFEHVGVPHYQQFFQTLQNLLKDDGVALLHTIGRSGTPGTTNPWITKYIFPGGYVPALSEIMTVVEQVGLVVSDIEIWRLHYAQTLQHWQRRFRDNIDRICALYDERFCRMWHYYLVASEMSFRHNDQVVFQIQLTKSNITTPLTRNYMY